MSSYTIPTVVRETPRGDRITDIYSHLLGERIVFVGTPIDDGVANVVVAQILHLASVRPEADIQLYLNSPGGSFSSFLAIYDTIQYVDADVATLCVGQAASTAAMLLAAGAPGKRSALPHARMLLHQPHTDARRGSLSDLALEAEELARVRSESEELLAHHTGRTPAQVRDDTDRALVLRAPDAVEYGLVDQIVASASGSQRQDRTRAAHPTADRTT